MSDRAYEVEVRYLDGETYVRLADVVEALRLFVEPRNVLGAAVLYEAAERFEAMTLPEERVTSPELEMVADD